MALKANVKFLLALFAICMALSPAYALHPHRKQKSFGMVAGRVVSNGVPVEFATVALKNTSFGCSADADGIYHLKAPSGKYVLQVSAVGFATAEKVVTIEDGERQKLNFELQANAVALEDVVVSGNGVQRINESAFNAVAVDTKALDNVTMNLSDVLNNVAGLNMRSDGGVGSSTQINLNGFTGKHVKVFMDGVPMEGNGSAFYINTIPASMADRVEVYKGVVPVDFGGDALGGAVNIVTRRNEGFYIDASYSFGSFNTHRSNVNTGYTAKNGFTASLSIFQNYSDNDYRVKTQYTDLGTNSVSNEEYRFRRFHDRYHNEAVVVGIGVVGKRWADKLLFGATYSHDYAQIQNANLMKIVFGGKHRKTGAWAPTLQYEKKDLFAKGLQFKLSARYNIVTTNNVDTVARQYSWTGDWIPTETQGEGVPTLAEYKGKTAYVVANLRYKLGTQHFFSLNNMFSDYRRQTTDNSANAVQSTAATFMRRINRKDVLGLSYKYMHGDAWNLVAFTKYYNSHVRGPVNVSATTGRQEYEEQARSIDALGYGAAGTWFVSPQWQSKVSVEKSYRLPTDIELFGDGDYETGDASLKPENSLNLNLNVSYDCHFATYHNIGFDLGLFYRGVHDYIIRTIGSKGTAVSSNHGNVRGLGGDIALRYGFKDALAAGMNFSYQDMRDREPLNAIGAPSVTYNNRVPNLPYAFGNADASYTFHNLMGKGSSLTVGYVFRYVNKFFRSWEGEGAKLYIPKQMSQDAMVSMSFNEGTYNVSFEANNFTDAMLYDNYSLQKPGRSFTIKLRYHFSKQ